MKERLPKVSLGATVSPVAHFISEVNNSIKEIDLGRASKANLFFTSQEKQKLKKKLFPRNCPKYFP